MFASVSAMLRLVYRSWFLCLLCACFCVAQRNDSEIAKTAIPSAATAIAVALVTTMVATTEVEPVTESENTERVSLPKCCPEGMTGHPRTCFNSSDPFLHPFRPWLDFRTYYSPLKCLYNQTFLDSNEYKVDNDGNLVMTQDGLPQDVIPQTDYCFDLLTLPSEEDDSSDPSSADLSFIAAFVCFDADDVEVPSGYPIGMMISIPFLAATCLTYAVIKKLRNFHGRCLVFQCTTMTLAYVCLVVTQLFGEDLHAKQCQFIGFAVQFFFLATFFWLNVMCIDIYWAFSDLKSLGRAAGTWRDRKKLLCYSAYAWGMPLLILCITLAVDYSPSIPTNSRFKPAMGLDKCFFRGRIAGWTYFYGPMAIILFINCLLFAVTAFHLYRHRRGTAGVLKRGDSQRHGGGNDKERFNLYLKLFIVMGINWLSEVVSFTFNTDVPRYLWYLTDITNTLQGVFIFLIFVWKQRVRQLIWDKLCKGKRGTASANNTSSTSITTNSIRSHHNSIKMNALNNISSVPNK